MASARYQRLLTDLRYGCCIQWRSSQAQVDHVIRLAAEALWPELISKVGSAR